MTFGHFNNFPTSVPIAQKALALGVATLDSGGKVPLSQIPGSLIGGLNFQGFWNANTNTPTLTSSVGTKGHFYIVDTAGSTDLDGITEWQVGDWAVFGDSAWGKVDNTDLWSRSGTDLTPSFAGDNINIGTGGLKDNDVSTAISLGDSGNTSFDTTNKTITGSINELKTDLDGFPDALKNLTTAEINQLENINLVTISNAQWGFLGAMDQGVATTDSVEFAAIDVDNLNLNGNTLSSTDTDGDVILSPDGTGDVSVASSKITNLLTPTADTDAATKAYVDARVQGLDAKPSCRLASDPNSNWTTTATADFVTATSILTISSLTAGASRGLIDTIEPVDDDRILLKDMATLSNVTTNSGAEATPGKYNVLWRVTGGTATTLTLERTTDADSDAEVTANLFTFVEEGTLADSGYTIITNDPIIVNVTDIVFTQFSGAGQITAGDGLDKSGNTLFVDDDDVTIYIDGSGRVGVKSSATANQVLLSDGTSTTPAWGALPLGNSDSVTGQLPIGNGGTGASTAGTAATALGLGTGNSPVFTGARLSGETDAILYGNNTGVVSSLALAIPDRPLLSAGTTSAPVFGALGHSSDVISAAGATPVNSDLSALQDKTHGIIEGTGGRIFHFHRKTSVLSFFVELTS